MFAAIPLGTAAATPRHMYDARQPEGSIGAIEPEARGAAGRKSLTAHLPPGDGSDARAHPLIESVVARAPGDDAGIPDMFEGILPRTRDDAGQGLPEPLRGQFERSLGTDLADVRVHTDGDAAASAASVGARAYAHGNDIHFGAGQFDPGSARGAWLLAHEVAHTVQQRGSPAQPQARREVSEPGDAAEVAADRAAEAMVAGAPVGPLAPVPRGIHRTPDYATASDTSFGASNANPSAAHIQQLTQLDSEHWRYERTISQPVELDGQPPFDGEFVVSRFHQGGHPAFLPRGANGQLELSPSVSADFGALPRFIENHAALARLWGLRLLRNADGFITHLVTPEPRTFLRIRESLNGQGLAGMTPASGIMAAEGNLNGQEFAQALRAGTPPISMPVPGRAAQATHPLYYHDWIQHMPGFLSLGSHTMGFLRLVGTMVRDLYQIADRRSNTPIATDMVAAAGPVHGRTSRLDPSEQAARNAELGNALRSAIEPVAGNGTLIEAEITFLGEAMAAPTAQIDRAVLRGHYRNLWSDSALTTAFATAPGANLPPDQQAAFTSALAEMNQLRAAYRAQILTLAGTRDASIEGDIDAGLQRFQQAEGHLARFSVRAAGQELSVLDEAGFARQAEGFAQAGTLVQAEADIVAERDRLRAEVERARNQRAAVRTYGSDASGAAVPSSVDVEQERRLEVLEQMVTRIGHARTAFGPQAEAQFIERFENVGLHLAAQAMQRAEAARSGQAQVQGAARRPADRISAAEIAAARAQLGASYAWTDEQVFQAVWRALNLDQHPVRAEWIRRARTTRRAPAVDHTLRNVLIASVVVLTAVTVVGVFGELAVGAGATAASATTETTAAAAATVFTTETAGAVTGVRVVVEAAGVATQLYEWAVLEAGASEAAAYLWML